ncbi:TonB-dependent receptor, partial [bacterium]|nr:TonB-dependent receptor [bacterium]
TYYDVLGKMEHKLSEKQALSAHVFVADDTYKLDEEELEPGITVPNIDFSDTHYGSKYGWLTLKSYFRSNVFARSMIYGGLLNQDRFWNNFDNDPKAHFNSGTINDTRDFKFFGFKQDWNFEASDKLFIKFGYDMKRSHVDYDYSKNIQNELLSPGDTILNRSVLFNSKKNLSGNQFAFFISTRFRVLPPLTLETGIRYDHASYTQENLWSPRLNALYAVTKKTSLRGGWGYYYQTPAPDELRIQFEETSMLPAQKAEHFVLGVDHQFDNGLYFRSEAYLKKITGVPVTYATLGADIDEFYPESRDDLVRLTVNKATAKGLEFYLKYDSGEKFSWWLSYVLSKAADDVTDVTFAGNMTARTGVQSRPWDQRHTLNIDAYYRLNPGWQFNLAWQYRSGWS